jgi:hypothetical protein
MDGMLVSAMIGLLGLILGLVVVYLTPPGDRDTHPPKEPCRTVNK